MIVKNFKNKVKKKIRQVKHKGLYWTARKFYSDHIYKHEEHILLFRDLHETLPEIQRKFKNWDIRILKDEKNFRDFETFFPDKIHEFSNYYSDGVIFGLSYYENDLVGYILWTGKNFRDPVYNYLVKPSRNQAYQFSGFLIPKYRGTLISYDGMKFCHEYLRDLGYDEVFCFVDTNHSRNMRFHFKFGFKESGGLLHFHKLFFLRWSKLQRYPGKLF